MSDLRKQQIHFAVDATLGSKFQRDFAAKTLDAVLEAWKADIERRHRKNKIIIAKQPRAAPSTGNRS